MDFSQRLAALAEQNRRTLAPSSRVSSDAMTKAASFLEYVGRIDRAKRDGSSSGSGADVGKEALANLLTAPQNQKPDTGGGIKWSLNPLKAPAMVGGILKEGAQATGLDNAVKTGLDYLSRPGYSLFTGMTDNARAINSGQNQIEALDDFLKGAWGGLKGDRHEGFGEFVEANASRTPGSAGWSDYLMNPSLLMGEGLNSEEIPDPVSRGAKIGLGAMGEIFADPLNLVGGKAVGLIGEARKPSTFAENLAEGASKAEKVKAKLKDAIPQVQGDTRVFNPVQYADEVNKVVDSAVANSGLEKVVNKKILARVPDELGVDGLPVYRNLPVGREAIRDRIKDTIADVVIQINAGANKYKVIGAQHIPGTMASRVAQDVEGMLTKHVDDAAQSLLEHANNISRLPMNRLTKGQKEVMEEYRKLLTNKRKGGFLAIENRLSPTSKAKVMEEAISNVKMKYQPTIDNLYNDIYNGLNGQVINAPGIRIGNKVVPFKRVGLAYADAKARHLSGEAFENLSHGKQFQGRTSLLNRRISSLGVRNYENFHMGKNGIQVNQGIRTGEESVVAMASKYTAKDRKFLQEALIRDERPTGPLGEAFDWLKAEYKKILDDEYDFGVRGVIDPKNPQQIKRGTDAKNYAYLYFRKGRKTHMDEFKNHINSTIKNHGMMPLDSMEQARKAGLKPVEDAFEALTLRKLSNNRKLSRAYFMDDLLTHYGVVANRLDSVSATKRGLKDVTTKTPKNLRTSLEKGDRYYLPGEIRDIFDKYVELSRGGNVSGFVQLIDKITRAFKFSATIPYPGFHVRNSMGDIFMSFLDGVNFSDYSKHMRWKRKVAEQGTDVVDIGLSGNTFKYKEIKDLFDEHARTGGFYRTDLGTSEVSVNLGQRYGQKSADWLRGASEKREDFFRFTHFMKAFGEEYNTLVKQGIKNRKILMRNAAENASFRVNKYLFDYSALTRTEREIFRRIIPFYTYQRKVLPTVLESMFMSPRNLAVSNRMFTPESADNFNPMLMPDYIREAGYATVSDQEEPWIFSALGLPTEPVSSNTNVSDPAEWLRGILSQSNPIAKVPMELAAGKQFFNEREITSTSDYLTGSLAPPVNAIQDWGTTEDGLLAEILSNRIGLGLPVDKVSQGQMDAVLYTASSDMKEQLGNLNDTLLSEKGLRIYLSDRKDGASFRIKNEESNEVIYEGDNVQDTIKIARKLAGR